MAHHVLLVVSPDPDASRALGGLVESMGNIAWLAASLDEARVALAEGGACGVIYDAATDLSPGARSRENRNVSALAELRAKDERRTPKGDFVLPFLGIAEKETTVEEAEALYTSGAGSVVRKPIAEKRELIGRKLEALLARAGRDDHAACDVKAVTAVEIARRRAHLALTGERGRGRTGLRVNGRAASAQNGHFVALLRLGIAHSRRRGGWATRFQLGIGRNEEIPSRLGALLRPLLPPGFKAIEADWEGSFRLSPELTVEIDLDALEEHPLPVVRKLVKEEREARAKVKKKR